MIKKKLSILTLTLILCLMLPAIFLAPEANYTRAMNDILTNQADFVISQQVGWSDDFDHGNITESGWSVQGFSTDEFPYPPVPGNFTTEDNTLRATGVNWSEAWRTSNVSFGSWAFDVYCVDSPYNRSYIAFVSGSPPFVPDTDPLQVPFEYGIIPVVGQYLSYDNAFVLYYRLNPWEDYHTNFIGDYDVEDASGWWHINITRYHNGTFNVYFNDTLGITVNNLIHKTSDLFTFTAEAGYALDNIVVVPYPDDEPPVIGDPELTPSTPNSTESVLVEVDVTDTTDVDTVILSYSNGATWFNITMTGTEPDYEGTIPALPGGTVVQYRFYANDTIGNWKVTEIDSYYVSHVPTPTPTPTPTNGLPIDMTILLVVGGGLALVVVLVIVVRLRK